MPKPSLTRVSHMGRIALFVYASTCFAPHVALAQIAVGDGGTPNYTQVIAVPPGVGGMAPKLSLVYTGGGVNGPVGYGWSVQGFSVITRCAATPAQDGRRSGVTYVASDKLCLDGQRLIQTDESGSPAPSNGYNAVGMPVTTQANDAQGLANNLYREFRTEKDIYARIRAYGYANNDATGASGPAYFRVWTKAGQIYEYGLGPAGDIAKSALIAAAGKPPIAWAVSRISDTLGNYIDFKYEQRELAWGGGPSTDGPKVGHEWNILEIQYSGNKVVFNYQLSTTSQNQSPAYAYWLDSGAPASGLDVRADKAEAYQQGNKNISSRRLGWITTYVNSPATALGPNGGTAVRTTTLRYSDIGATARSRIDSIKECVGDALSTRCLPATTFSYTSGGGDAYVSSAQFAQDTLATTALLAQSGGVGVLVGDFDGDGKADILVWGNESSSNRLYLSNGDGSFRAVPVGSGAGQFNLSNINLFKQAGASNRIDACYMSVVTDLNGDGVADILRWSSGGIGIDGTNCPGGDTLALISNGDGSFRTAATLSLSRALGTSAGGCIGGHTDCIFNRFNFFVGDFNGDGIADIINSGFGYAAFDGGSWFCLTACDTALSVGKGDGTFLPSVVISNKPVFVEPSERNGATSALDMNGDGISDLLVLGPNYTGMALLSGPGGTFSRVSLGMNCNVPAFGQFADFNGDGRADFLCASLNVAQNAVYLSDGSLSLLPNLSSSTQSGTLLNNAGDDLVSSGAAPGARYFVVDVNGDGRSDIVRLADNPSQNKLYKSNGDGSFFLSTTFSFDGASAQLTKSDGTVDIVVGDFLGNGTLQILSMVDGAATATTATGRNKLYIKADATPPDLLIGSRSSSSLNTNIYYFPLINTAIKHRLS